MNANEMFPNKPSKYLKCPDLGGRFIVVTMDRVAIETIGQGIKAETKPVLYFQGKEKGLVLNKTNKNSIVAIVGTAETDNWRGQRIVLHPAMTEMDGKPVECIRVARPPANSPPVTPITPAIQRQPSPAADEFHASDDDVPF